MHSDRSKLKIERNKKKKNQKSPDRVEDKFSCGFVLLGIIIIYFFFFYFRIIMNRLKFCFYILRLNTRRDGVLYFNLRFNRKI